ncbi:hypothetical protein FWP33_26265 [Vibrio parahaemolyticus]|nr:hypothetical protein [Vibrio parahaemolyticus]
MPNDKDLMSILLQIVVETKNNGQPSSSTIRSAELLLGMTAESSERQVLRDNAIVSESNKVQFQVSCKAEAVLHQYWGEDDKLKAYLLNHPNVVKSEAYIEFLDLGRVNTYQFKGDNSVVIDVNGKYIGLTSIQEVMQNFTNPYIEFLMSTDTNPYIKNK